MTGLFQRTSKSGSNATCGRASDIKVSSFKPATETGHEFAISIRFKVDTGHKVSLAIYGQEAKQFIENCMNVNPNPDWLDILND